VVKIIDNPISIRQAFFSPYRKVSGFIEKQINKMAATQDEKVTGDITGQVEKAPVKVADSKTKTDPPPPFDVGKFVGIFAAIGLAVGAIGTAIASVIAGFMKLEWWKMPFAMIGLLLVVSGPSMVIAYLKLRRRSLAPLLDANGWAINAKVIINVQFGNTLTHMAALPKGAKVNFHDPFSEKKRPILPAILILSLLAGILIYFLRKYGIIHIRF
jgi:MFS family permease